MEVWKMIFLFNWVIFTVPAVNFPGCWCFVVLVGTGGGLGPRAATSLLVIRFCWHVWLYIMRFKGNKKKRKANLVIKHPVNVDVTSLITHPFILPHPYLLVRVVLDVSETILLPASLQYPLWNMESASSLFKFQGSSPPKKTTKQQFSPKQSNFDTTQIQD